MSLVINMDHEAAQPEVVQLPETCIHSRTGGATRGNTPPRGRRGPNSPVFQSGTFQRLDDGHPRAKDFTHVCSEGACGDSGGKFFKLTKDKRNNWCTSKAVNHLKSEHPTTTGAVYMESEAKNQVRTTYLSASTTIVSYARASLKSGCSYSRPLCGHDWCLEQ